MIKVDNSEILSAEVKKVKVRTKAVYPGSSHNLRLVQSPYTSKEDFKCSNTKVRDF